MKRSEGPVPAVLCCDADNTLWDTDAVFANAQLGLLEDVERALGIAVDTPDRLAFVREIDQELAIRHHQGLRYPPRLLAHAVAGYLAGTSVPDAVNASYLGRHQGGPLNTADAERAVARYLENIRQRPEARPGVAAALSCLSRRGVHILVVTESDKAKCRATLQALGLDGFVTRVIEGIKRRELFERIARLYPRQMPMTMVGDQIDRDILPARDAGFRTALFPGRFRPKWTLQHAANSADIVIDDLSELEALILNVDRRGKLTL